MTETQYRWFDDRACRYVIVHFDIEPQVFKDKYWFNPIYTQASSDTRSFVTGYGFILSGLMSQGAGLRVANWVPW